MKACISPLAKVDCLCTKTNCFQLTKGRLLTGFRDGQILSLTLLYDLETSRTMLNSMANGFERNIFGAEAALQCKIKVEKNSENQL